MTCSPWSACIALAAALLCGCEVPPTTEPTPVDRGAAIRRFWSLYREATAMRTRGDFETAAHLYEQTLQIDPNHEDCLYYYGQSLQERADYGGARAAFERLVEVNPVSARGHLALGTLLTGAEVGAPFDLARAEEHLMRAHQINGEETAPMVRIGEILIMRGDMQGARHWLEAAARTNPKSTEAACLSGYLRWLAGDPDGASEFYAKAIRASQADKPAHGVLNEGDRKAATAAVSDPNVPVAAPPLKKPMGETLFGRLCADLPEQPPSLDAVYDPIQSHSRLLAARMSPH